MRSNLMRTSIRLSLVACCLGFHLCLAVADTRVGSTASTNAVVTDNSAAVDPFAAENAPAQPRARISDPLERVNRGFFWFNDKLYLCCFGKRAAAPKTRWPGGGGGASGDQPGPLGVI